MVFWFFRNKKPRSKMDRRRKEVRNIIKNFQNECNITVELLNKLLVKCRLQAEVFQNVDENDFKPHTERFLAFTQFHNGIIRKLLEFDITVENLIDDADRSPVSLTESFRAVSRTEQTTPFKTAEVTNAEIQTDSLQNAKLDMIHSYLHGIEGNSPSDTKVQKVKDVYESISSSEYFCCTSTGDDLKTETSKTSLEIHPPKTDITLTPPMKYQEETSHGDYEKEINDFKWQVISEHCEVKVNDLCMIGCINSPTNFYIQIANDNSVLLDDLSYLLEATSEYRPLLSKKESMESLGRYCCVKIDEYWYRVEVLDWLMDTKNEEEDVTIQLIDFGTKFQHSYKNLRFLCKEAYRLPKMAQLCHLEGIRPLCSSTNYDWPRESIDSFLDICGDLDNAIFRISYVSSLNERNSYGVGLLKIDDQQPNYDISQILLDRNLAVRTNSDIVIRNNFMINQIQTCQGLRGINEDTSRDDILEKFFENNKIVEAGNVSEAIMNYNPRDEALTCKNLRPDGTCYKGSACRYRHILLQDGFTYDRAPVYNRAYTDMELPEVNDEIFLKVCHVINIHRFYARIRVKNDHPQDRPTISYLVKTMNNEDTVKMYKKLRYPPGLSQMVIVKHWNNNWYRGQVRSVQIPENDNNEVKADVYVVDYGDTLTVPLSDLREMLGDFLQLPFQAIECRIYNVRPKQGVSESEEKRYLESLCLSDTFKAKVVAVQSHLHVLLYTRDGDDIGETIIAAGYGEPNNEHDIPANDGIYLID
ncbi:hypothetical protein RI129_009268 [Pyrocoelia pectoralis]|uniref:Uncharacterized protein n=1 Tax=Pyrocoelia pectoralis TaxID=417401 RepID=A0AAN7V871_9COLE